jgi:hypothetical protein
MPAVHPNRIQIIGIEKSVGIDVNAEVAAGNGIVPFLCPPFPISLTDLPIPIDITNKEAKRNIAMLPAISIDILHAKSHDLGVGNSRQLRRHGIPIKYNRSHRCRALLNRYLSGLDRGIKRENSIVGKGTAIFDS